jgi:hypothetical protein
MEHGRSDGTNASAVIPGPSPGSPSWAAWDAYYREASRRRRKHGRGSTFRDQKRKRRLKERLGIALSALLVMAMTGVFYLVLK